MNWKDEMKEAMKAIKEACEKNPSWTECCQCPFWTCCTAMMDMGLNGPEDWGPNVDEF